MYRTNEEWERLLWEQGWQVMADKIARLDALEGLEATLEKEYECREEQSEFRRALIEEILGFCDSATTVRDLKAAIRKAVADSYVEL